MKDLATKFIRVRLARIDDVDLNLFEFDYDLTFAVFFLNAKEQIYARYGDRDGKDAEARLSLAGLRYTMQLVLASHDQRRTLFAKRRNKSPLYVRRLVKFRKSTGCIHCHEAKEMVYASLKDKGQWQRDLAWRYPLPNNLGFTLEVDRGNVVKHVTPKSPAHRAGLQAGDVLQLLNGASIRSLADARFALDQAPTKGTLAVAWKRGAKTRTSQLPLPAGWRKTDITWRPSVWRLVPRLYLFGKDLTAPEKKALGLSIRQTAFRQDAPVSAQARNAGIREGDIILGVEDKKLELDVRGFLDHVRAQYLVGDRLMINILRNGKRLRVPLVLK